MSCFNGIGQTGSCRDLVVSAACFTVGLFLSAAVMAQESGASQKRGDIRVPAGGGQVGQRVEIAEGEIAVREFLRFLADHTGLPVVVSSRENKNLEEAISVVAPIPDAGEEIVTAILKANGWSVVRRTLESGKEVLEVRRDSPRPQRTVPAATPRPVPRTGTAQPWNAKQPVYRFGEKGLELIEASESSLVGKGLKPSDPATVVVRLRRVVPRDAMATLSELLTAGMQPGVDAAEFRVAEVRGALMLILMGEAARVDHAVRVLQAIDSAEGRPAEPMKKAPEKIVEVIQVQHADVRELLVLVTDLLSSQRPAGRASRRPTTVAATPRPMPTRTVTDSLPTTIVADSRTKKLVVQTHSPADLKLIQMLVGELDVPLKVGALKTHIFKVKHSTAERLASFLEPLIGGRQGQTPAGRQLPGVLLVPHKDTNSLLVQADDETLEGIKQLIQALDVPPAVEKRE